MSTDPQQTGLESELPDCPHCGQKVRDPGENTADSGVYDVVCECKAWLEIWRRCHVVLEIRRWDPTVPPYIYLGE